MLSAERFGSGRLGPRLRSRERAFRERATAAWRAVEAQAAGPTTQRGTTCPGCHGKNGAGHVRRGVTAPDHGGHGASHGITHCFHCAGHRGTAITVTRSGQRARFPRRRRPPGQRLSQGRAGGTKTTGRGGKSDLTCDENILDCHFINASQKKCVRVTSVSCKGVLEFGPTRLPI